MRPRCGATWQRLRRWPGPDRAALLAALVPVTTAAKADRATARTKALRKKLVKIDIAETALVTELETPADPDDPAAQALRNRIRARFTELYAERTRIQNDLAALETMAGEPADDPTLVDELPLLGDILTNAPDALIERLLALFDLRAIYHRDKHQLTVRATLTDGTRQALRDLMDDPRADHNQQASAPGPNAQDSNTHSTRPTGSSPRTDAASPLRKPPRKRARTRTIAIRIRSQSRHPRRRGRNGRSRPVLRFTRQAIRNIPRLCPGIDKYVRGPDQRSAEMARGT